MRVSFKSKDTPRKKPINNLLHKIRAYNSLQSIVKPSKISYNFYAFTLQFEKRLKIRKIFENILHKSFYICAKVLFATLATCIEFAFMRPQAELSTRP